MHGYWWTWRTSPVWSPVGHIRLPSPHAHVTTTTTYKSLRGARGGMILTDDDDLHRRFASALFPGIQGSAMLHAMAGKAACLGEALTAEFADYAAASVVNAQALASEIQSRDFVVVSGGTDTSLLLVDLRSRGITGKQASDRLEQAGLTCNKNAVPFDDQKPTVTSGLRILQRRRHHPRLRPGGVRPDRAMDRPGAG